MFANLSIALSIVLLFKSQWAVAAAANPTVTIASGVVIGTATGVTNQPAVTGLVNAYLGVPYASPPVRFSPPQAAKAWSTPLKAQSNPPACIQQFIFTGDAGVREQAYFNNPGFAPPAESEDCLYLNIFAPRDASPTNKKPVLFWIFGGDLQFGTASLQYYNGSSLAINQGVVVVAINYRTNIFGFSNSPEIPFTQQNSGYLDQRFALNWVNKNIAAFGGDPSKVTIFGESAGGESVKQLLVSPPQPIPFHGAIMESQASFFIGSGSDSYKQTVKNFKCDTAVSQIACLRTIPATDIKNYITSNMLFFPPVNNDGTSTQDVRPSIAAHTFAQVPILIGSNAQEFAVFAAILGLNNVTNVFDEVANYFGFNSSSSQQSLQSIYGQNVAIDPYTFIDDIATDLIWTCPTSTLSTYLAQHGYPTWRYYYNATFPNLNLFKCPNNGCAYHTAEIPSVFGTYSLQNNLGAATSNQIALSKYMQGIWAGWAANPAAGPGWPQVGSNNGQELGVLGGPKAPTGEYTAATSSVDYPCFFLNPFADAFNFSY